MGITRPVVAISVARMTEAIGNSILFIIIPLYVAQMPDHFLDLPTPVLVGGLISLYGFVTSALQPFAGALSDHLGRRKLLIQLGLGMMAVGTLAFISADHFIHLILFRTFQGIGVALTVTASMALMAGITEKVTRGSSMGIYSTFRLIGFTTGPVIGGFLKVHFGFSVAFIAGALFIFMAMLLIHIWVKDIRFNNHSDQKRGFRIIEPGLINPGIWSAALATFIMSISFSLVITLENEFNARLETTAVGFSIAFSALMIGRLIFQIPIGKLSDYWGRKPLILIGLFVMAVVTALMGQVQTIWQLIVLRLIQGVAAAGIAAPVFAVAADLTRTGGEGRQMSILTTAFGLGIAVGPLIAGILVIPFFELPFWTGGLMSLCGVWMVYKYMPETVTPKSVAID